MSIPESKSAYFSPDNIEREVGSYLVSKQKLGEGGTAVVKLAWNRQRKELAAAKLIAKYRLTDRGRDNLERELQIHSFISKFRHPNICNLFEVIETTQHFYIFMEYVPSGDLVTFIESKGKVPEEEAKGIFRQVMEAIQFIHSNSIVHRDIKAENFLLTLPDDEIVPDGATRTITPRLKLTDFGLADWTTDDKSFSTPCGSPSYTAPEVVDRKPYRGEPTDVWSAGILLYALLVGEFPFSHPNIIALFEQIKKGQMALPDYLTEDAKDLIRKMLQRDSSQRISVEQTLDHPWLRIPLDSSDDSRLPKSWFM